MATTCAASGEIEVSGRPSALSHWKTFCCIVAVALAAGWRIFAFTPQPLDSPSSLRPLLYSWFAKFVARYQGPAQAQHAWNVWCLCLLLFPPLLAVGNYLWSRNDARVPRWLEVLIRSRSLFYVSIAASLIAARFPILLLGELNSDEGQFLTAACKLFRDPNFYRAVDCGTTGPLNIFPLMFPAAFGFSPDFSSGRLIALAVILVSIIVIHRAISLTTTEAAARVVILPLAGSFAVLKYWDFLHYSSEHPSLLLLALAIYASARSIRYPETSCRNLSWIGLLAAATFFAKMQCVPVVGCIAMVTLVWTCRSVPGMPLWKPWLAFLCGAAPLFLLNLAVCVAGGVWKDFWMAYIVGNHRYVPANASTALATSRFARFVFGRGEIRWMIAALLATGVMSGFVRFRNKRSEISLHALLLVLAGVSVALAAEHFMSIVATTQSSFAGWSYLGMAVGCAVIALFEIRSCSDRVIRWMTFEMWIVLPATFLVVYTPQRNFGHYLVLLILPLAIVTSLPFMTSTRFRRRADSLPFVLAFVALAVGMQVGLRNSPDGFRFSDVPKNIRPEDGALIASMVPQGGEITVWGWDVTPYLGSGRPPATRDTNVAGIFHRDAGMSEYYRNRYLRDMKSRPADMFIDVVDSDQQAFGFEAIPAIGSYIQSNYVYVGAASNHVYYLRRDLAQGMARVGTRE